MNGVIRHIRSLWIAVVLIAMFGACTDEPEQTAVPSEPAAAGSYGVGLRLTVGDISASRATPPGDYGDGRSTAYENYINIPDGDFRVLLFESQAPYRLIDALNDVRVTAVEADIVNSKTYVLTGNIAKPVEGSFKLAILANWEGCGAEYPETVSGQTTIDEVANASLYRYAADFELGPGRGIPMYGIKDCANVKFLPDMAADLGTLHLLRALAKVEVRTAAGSLAITEIRLTRAHTGGLAAPRGIYRQQDYVKESYAADYLDGIHLPAATEMLGEIPFREVAAGRYVLYVPEYDNTSADAGKTRIRLSFEQADGQEYFVDFKFYDAQTAREAGARMDDPFDIRRNHYYIYTVDKKFDTDLRAIVDVIPYIGVPLDPEFGLKVDDNGNTVDSEGNVIIIGRDGRIILLVTPDGRLVDRSGKDIVPDKDGYVRGEDGKPLLEIKRTDDRIVIRDGEGKLITVIIIK